MEELLGKSITYQLFKSKWAETALVLAVEMPMIKLRDEDNFGKLRERWWNCAAFDFIEVKADA